MDIREAQNAARNTQNLLQLGVAVVGGIVALLGIGAFAYELWKASQPAIAATKPGCSNCPPPPMP